MCKNKMADCQILSVNRASARQRVVKVDHSKWRPSSKRRCSPDTLNPDNADRIKQ